MAVYGIGAMYDGTDDQTTNFKNNGVACIGWTLADAPALHAQMSSIKTGDVIFIKSFSPKAGLHIKAVGIVTDASFRETTLGWGVRVRWVSMPEHIVIGPVRDRSDYMRTGSLYEEFNPVVIHQVLDVLVPQQGQQQDRAA